MTKHLSAWIAALVCSCSAPSWAAETNEPIRLVFAGDVVLNADAGRLIQLGGDPFSEFSGVFKNADIRLANLECVVTTQGAAGSKIYSFRAHPRVLPVLKRHFDALALANNHSGDFGRAAFADMLTRLRQSGMDFFGGGHNLAQAHAPLIVQRQGLRIALLSYNEFMPRSFEADHNTPGIAWSEDEQVVADIQQARSVHRADLVIPVMHWGWENETVSNPRQRKLARTMIDAGADVVIGGHPHVTQEIELYQGKPIIYSVGNFVMKETDNANQRVGWVLRLQLDRQGVRHLDTVVARLNMKGIPRRDREAQSPCWQRGQSSLEMCRNAD